MSIRAYVRAIAMCGAFVGAAAGASAMSCGGGLLPNEALAGAAGSPPLGMFQSVSYDPGVSSRGRLLGGGASLLVDYRYGKDIDGKPYIDIDLENKASTAANFTLYFSTAQVNLAPGQTYSLSGRVLASAFRSPVMLGLGFQFYKPDGSYLSEMVPSSGGYQPWTDAPQDLTAGHVGGAPDPGTGGVPGKALPRLSLYNLPVDARLRLRLSCITLKAEAAPPDVRVLPLKKPLGDVRPGQVLPLTVNLASRPVDKVQQPSKLNLRNVKGESWAFDGRRPLALSHWGPMREEWALRIPKHMPVGRYDLEYELPGLGVRAKLGSVRIGQQAGMWIGMTFHRYPGSSEKSLGPLSLRYQFARSLAGEHGEWWLGPDEYDWKGLTRWADFHAAPGERKLLITFSGSPRWASARPREPSAMGLPGYAAPPAEKYRGAYQRMVKETVSRFKDRILATECWNEPNSSDFFSGTQTELADLCKAVHDATKAVDERIQVICPQADDPTHLDFVYGARTSEGQPIHRYCDMVGAHIYNHLGRDAEGRSYTQQSLEDAMAVMASMSRKYGIVKPIAITEFGINSCVARPTRDHPLTFGRMGSDVASEAMYQSLVMLRSESVQLVSLYSFDTLNNDPECRPGGSFARTTTVDKSGRQVVDPVMVKRLSEAVEDLGRSGGQ
jgi:hypothetical protein